MSLSWIKLANFGEYRHRKGSQLLNANSAKDIVDSFRSIRGRLMRKFRGIPIFIGHPDDPEFSPKNDRIYGRIGDLKIKDDALWILVKWTEIGRELFESGIIKYFSPRWMTSKAADGKLLPKRLLSVGLTNHPNIQCDHVSTEEQSSLDLGEFGNDPELLPSDPGQESSQKCLHNRGDKVEENVCGENFPVTGLVTSATDNPIHAPEIALHTVSQTDDLWQCVAEKSSREKILELVFERMHKFSEQYNDAWMAVKRGNPALFHKNF
ncbi:MAG: phage protease [Puniceicoccales bacterium]|jgi:hypothetical protein|nr:phage protease [Puniceicoccales bacterium]